VDLESGKKTEIDYLNGEVVQLGNKLGISCPVNQKIVQLIKEAEKVGRSPNIPPREVQSTYPKC
jgi:2-dehydropantoate 2-reductase